MIVPIIFPIINNVYISHYIINYVIYFNFFYNLFVIIFVFSNESDPSTISPSTLTFLFLSYSLAFLQILSPLHNAPTIFYSLSHPNIHCKFQLPLTPLKIFLLAKPHVNSLKIANPCNTLDLFFKFSISLFFSVSLSPFSKFLYNYCFQNTIFCNFILWHTHIWSQVSSSTLHRAHLIELIPNTFLLNKISYIGKIFNSECLTFRVLSIHD